MGGYTICHERRNVLNDDYKNFVVMNKSNHSYALNNKITSLFNSNSWLGRRCFIIGGGESLKGFDFNRLNNELTIGVNKAFKFYPKSTINYSMDSTFYDQLKRGDFDIPNEPRLVTFWNNYQGTRVFLTPMEIKTFGPEVYVVRKELTPFVNRTNLDVGIYGGVNSGTGAISLAVALGAKNIFLLGYDMKCVNSTHYHEGYEKRNLDEFNRKLLEYRDDIAKLSTVISAIGVNMVNLNKDSALTCFPFDDFERIL